MKQEAIKEYLEAHQRRGQQPELNEEGMEQLVFTGKDTHFLGFETEIKALDMLKTTCQAKIDGFKNDDAGQIKYSKNLSQKKVILMQYNVGQKKILETIIEGIDRMNLLYTFNNLKDCKKEAFRQQGKQYKDYMNYITGVILPEIEDREKKLKNAN